MHQNLAGMSRGGGFDSMKVRACAIRTVILMALAIAAMPRDLPARVLGWSADALSVKLDEAGGLPATPDGIAEIKFSELWEMPVGPRGLECSEKARRLDGRRVRIFGFMVEQDEPVPGLMILAPYALKTSEEEYGLCDDLPPTVVSVEVPAFSDRIVPFTPGPLLLTGRLELGAREEKDGRVSHVRLALDEPPPASSETAAIPAK